MQQSKQARNAIPRNDIRSSAPSRFQRLNSDKFQDRNASDGIWKSRSNSARVKPEEFIDEFIEDPEEQQPEHKVGCPWQKSRSRTRYVGVTESTSGTMHPKPWGARNPKDIPCFCQMTRSQSRGSANSQPIQKPTTQSGGSRPPGRGNKKISEIVDNLGIFLERRKIKLNENEAPFLMKKIEEKVQHFIDRPSKANQQKQQDRKEPVKRQRNPLSLSPMRRQQVESPKQSLSRERMMEIQKSKIGGGPANYMGKLETKKCLLELTGEEQVPNNLRHILGTMNPAMIPADKMLFAVDDQQQAYLSSVPEDYRQYMVKTIDMEDYQGLQLHHQAANTTVLLAPKPRKVMNHGQGQLLLSKAHQAPLYKQGRRMIN